MLHVPFRGGVRGGKDQFTWESVKSDKDRECYLGHSIKAPVGRWQKGKDIHWYASEKGGSQTNPKNEEFQKAKELEEKALMAALGYKVVDKPKVPERPQRSESESEAEEIQRDSRNKKKKQSTVSGPVNLSSSDKKNLDKMLKKLVAKNGLDKVLKALIVESSDDEDKEDNKRKKLKSSKEDKLKLKQKSKKYSSDESSDENRNSRRKLTNKKHSSDESSEDEYSREKNNLKRKRSKERDYTSKRSNH